MNDLRSYVLCNSRRDPSKLSTSKHGAAPTEFPLSRGFVFLARFEAFPVGELHQAVRPVGKVERDAIVWNSRGAARLHLPEGSLVKRLFREHEHLGVLIPNQGLF